MLSQEDIARQQELLSTYRKHLAILLEQRASYGPVSVPPSIEFTIIDTREKIARIKSSLHERAVEVEDHPDDDEPASYLFSARLFSPALAHDIRDCRDNIRRIKATLRSRNQAVADEPDDEELTPAPTAEADSASVTAVAGQPVDFVIGAALEEGLDAILEKLPGYQRIFPSQDDIRIHYAAQVPVALPSGETGAYNVRVLLLGEGQVEAALAAANAFRRWEPEYMLFVGIAGGVAANGVSLGDVLVADQILHYELQELRANHVDMRYKTYPINAALIRAAHNFRGSWQQLLMADRPAAGTPGRHIGPIASGDKVIAYGRMVESYRDIWLKLVGVEMEAAGVAAATFRKAQPARFFMVCGVSDLADTAEEPQGESHPVDNAAAQVPNAPDATRGSRDVQRWRAYVCDVAASYAIAFLRSGPVPMRTTPSQSAAQRRETSPRRSDRLALTVSDRVELATLVLKYGSDSKTQRSLCTIVEVDPEQFSFPTNGREFAFQLVEHLHQTNNVGALLKLCDTIVPALREPYAQRATTIRTKLNITL